MLCGGRGGSGAESRGVGAQYQLARFPSRSDRLSHSDLLSGIRDILSAIACAIDCADSAFSSPTHRYSLPAGIFEGERLIRATARCANTHCRLESGTKSTEHHCDGFRDMVIRRCWLSSAGTTICGVLGLASVRGHEKER